jgi:hypothetical protein
MFPLGFHVVKLRHRNKFTDLKHIFALLHSSICAPFSYCGRTLKMAARIHFVPRGKSTWSFTAIPSILLGLPLHEVVHDLKEVFSFFVNQF